MTRGESPDGIMHFQILFPSRAFEASIVGFHAGRALPNGLPPELQIGPPCGRRRWKPRRCGSNRTPRLSAKAKAPGWPGIRKLCRSTARLLERQLIKDVRRIYDPRPFRDGDFAGAMTHQGRRPSTDITFDRGGDRVWLRRCRPERHAPCSIRERSYGKNHGSGCTGLRLDRPRRYGTGSSSASDGTMRGAGPGKTISDTSPALM